MKLYAFWRSTASWRVRIALAYKDLPYALMPVDLQGGSHRDATFRVKSPMEQVPVLEVVDDGKTVLLTQSLAILEYLEERFPEPALLPKARLERAQVRAVAEIINSGIQPLQNSSVQARVKDTLHGDERAWCAHWIEKGLTALEQVVAPSAGRYCVGDALSVADVCLVPQLFFARRFGVEAEGYPVLARIEAECARLASFRVAHALAQPDAPH